MTSKSVYHWTKKRLAPTGEQERYILYLFNETGTLQGYVQNTKEDLCEAFVGVPSEQIGLFDALEDAKNAVLYCLTGEEAAK